MEKNTVDFKLASLSREQQEKINQIESELGCVLIAYKNENQSFK